MLQRGNYSGLPPGYEELVIAVVEMAAHDYRREMRKGDPAKAERILENMKPWVHVISKNVDPQYIIERLRKEFKQ